MKNLFLSFIIVILFPIVTYATDTSHLNIAQIERIIGLTGEYSTANKSFKISIPRTDLNVAVTNMKLSAQMGMTSWVMFKNTDHNTSVVGDLVLSEEQVSPVLTSVVDSGLNIVSLNNHYLWEGSRVMFLRINGAGDPAKLATSVAHVLAELKSTSDGRGEFPYTNIDITKSNISSPRMDAILGLKSSTVNGIYKVVFGDNIDMNSWATFAGSDTEAVVSGDLKLMGCSVCKIIKPLKKAGIYVVAIHQHVSEEGKSFVCLHFWGIGQAATLAYGLRNVLHIKTVAEAETLNAVIPGKLMNSTMEKFIKPFLSKRTSGPA